MKVRDLVLLPIRVVWAVVTGCAVPAVIALVAWWLLPSDWAKWVIIPMCIWAGCVVLLIATRASGEVRSLGRGPIHLRSGDSWL